MDNLAHTVNDLVQTVSIYALPVLFAITLHEAAHGYVARHFGDMTAHAQGHLISWGDTEHPATSAPHGLTLEAFHLEHPDPPSLASVLAALGADVEIRPAGTAAFVARLSGPNGSHVLR